MKKEFVDSRGQVGAAWRTWLDGGRPVGRFLLSLGKWPPQECCRDGAGGEVTGAKKPVSCPPGHWSSRKKRDEALRHTWHPLRATWGTWEGQTAFCAVVGVVGSYRETSQTRLFIAGVQKVGREVTRCQQKEPAAVGRQSLGDPGASEPATLRQPRGVSEGHSPTAFPVVPQI